MKKIYTWYVSPLNAHTNQVIVETMEREIMVDQYINQNYLIECPFQLINFFIKSEKKFNLKFKIYNKKGKGGKIREINFLRKKTKGRK